MNKIFDFFVNNFNPRVILISAFFVSCIMVIFPSLWFVDNFIDLYQEYIGAIFLISFIVIIVDAIYNIIKQYRKQLTTIINLKKYIKEKQYYNILYYAYNYGQKIHINFRISDIQKFKHLYKYNIVEMIDDDKLNKCHNEYLYVMTEEAREYINKRPKLKEKFSKKKPYEEVIVYK